MKFMCKLKTDVILNLKSASEGNNKTLDFIPGNVFLGIVAGKLYGKLTPEESAEMFHSGKVRFGDAHLAINGSRSWKIPAEFFQDKIMKEKGNLYVHYGMTEKDHKELRENDIQLKQCRSGFYWLQDHVLVQAKVNKSFAIKSAYDRENRTSLKDAMFGYEALQEGTVFYFSIDGCNKKQEEQIKAALTEKDCFIGRSRTAQYGMAHIEEMGDFEEITSNPINSSLTAVYADGRLIFQQIKMDDEKFDASCLGLKGGKIRWDLSQVRTFQYAPWNSKRQAYDPDRYGVEKGSVFVVENAEGRLDDSDYVGSYKNEGFGKVIYNPSFLTYGEKGVSPYNFPPKNKKKPDVKEFGGDNSTPLLAYVSKKYKEEAMTAKLYKLVNDSMADQKKRNLFTSEKFASQWGHIRTLAMQYHDDVELKKNLFTEPLGYLVHGTAAEKWSEHGREQWLKDKCKEAGYKEIPLYLFLVNLASQMQKYYRNKQMKDHGNK